ncbi:MAG: DUF2520 domain-containing protein [Saprospiraceae bacterium]
MQQPELKADEVVLVGAGNVGWHVGQRLKEKGIRVNLVYSRQKAKAEALGRLLGCAVTNLLAAIPGLNNCLYILAVKDDVITEVAESIRFLDAPNRLFVHTSGATPSSVLTAYFSHSGVFYPLQTFSIDRQVNFSRVPLCIYGSDQEATSVLFDLGKQLSDQVAIIDDHQRSVLHVAAVFVNNFSNYLFGIGKDLVENKQLSFDLLRPLLMETAEKIMDRSPDEMQTGPARRHDQSTIATHLEYLERYPEWRKIYQLLSKNIEEKYA